MAGIERDVQPGERTVTARLAAILPAGSRCDRAAADRLRSSRSGGENLRCALVFRDLRLGRRHLNQSRVIAVRAVNVLSADGRTRRA